MSHSLLVYDATALLALFRSHEVAYHYWQRADRNEITAVFPAAALAEANRWLQASWDTWSPLIWSERVDVAPLDTSAALDSTAFAGSIATAHVLREARHLGGAILTDRPQDYAGAAVPVLTL